MLRDYLQKLVFLIFFTVTTFNSIACDGMSVNVISNEDLGDGTYRITIQYCEEVSNGGTSAVSGIILDVNGANVISTSTPSFTSSTTGVTINYNVIDGNTVQWGEWDNNPSVPDFMDEGDPEECFTIVIITDASPTSITVGGSSAAIDEGNGFVSWNGRYTCRIDRNVPPAPCNPPVPTFDPIPDVCQNASVTLPTTSNNGITGTWTPVVNTSNVGTINYTFNSSGPGCISSAVLPITVIASGTPTFDPIPNLCIGEIPPTLPTTSTNGVSGTWSGAISTATAGVFNFTFTPTPPTCYNSTQISVTVNSLPTVDAGTNQNVCEGVNVTLNGSGANSYTWDNSVIDGVAFSPPVGTTTYTVTGTDINGCQNTDNVNVTVTALPNVDAGPDQTICIGENVVLTATGATTYNWSNGGSNGQTVSPNTTTTYTVIGTTGSCQNSDDITITVNPLTTPTFDPIADVCQNATAPVLPTTSTNGIDGTWSGTVNTTNSGTFNFTFTPNSTCYSTTQISVTVTPSPVVDAGTYTSVCIDAANIPLSGTPAGGTFSGTGVTGNNFSPAVGTQTITYNYTDGNGCTGSDDVTITIFDLPNINAGSNITICEGQSVTLNGSGGTSYVWTNGGINGQPFTPSAGQYTYTVTGTDANGCQSTDDIVVNVVDMPFADVTADSTIGFPGLTVNFDNNSSVTNEYYWNYGNGTTEVTNNLNSTSSSYNTPGTYNVILTATNGTCTDYDTVQIVILELPEPIIEAPNVFTPNGDASNDYFFIDTKFTSNISYIIVNRWGNLIYEADGINPLWDGRTKNGTPVEEGVYFYKYEALGLNGQTYTGHGNVTLIRK